MERNKIICFDLDGVLVDSNKAHAASFNIAFKQNKLPELPEEKIIEKFGPPAEKIVKAIFPDLDENKIKKIVEAKREALIKRTYKIAKPLAHVKKALTSLKEKFKLVIYSHSTEEEIIALLKAAKLDKNLFDAIFDKNKIHEKPDIDILSTIENYVQGKIEWVVGDTTYDILIGKNGEVKTIAVLTGVHSLEKLRSANPTVILQSVALMPLYLSEEL
ncbi:MAG: HAD family hydrolase [Candidatus Nanoarchaeia archaeon]